MTQFLALLAALSIVLANSIGLMMLGWGVTPRSWWAISGFGLVGSIITHTIMSRVVKDISK